MTTHKNLLLLLLIVLPLSAKDPEEVQPEEALLNQPVVKTTTNNKSSLKTYGWLTTAAASLAGMVYLYVKSNNYRYIETRLQNVKAALETYRPYINAMYYNISPEQHVRIHDLHEELLQVSPEELEELKKALPSLKEQFVKEQQEVLTVMRDYQHEANECYEALSITFDTLEQEIPYVLDVLKLRKLRNNLTSISGYYEKYRATNSQEELHDLLITHFTARRSALSTLQKQLTTHKQKLILEQKEALALHNKWPHQLFKEYTDYAQRNQELITCLDNLILQIPYVPDVLKLRKLRNNLTSISGYYEKYRATNSREELHDLLMTHFTTRRSALSTLQKQLAAHKRQLILERKEALVLHNKWPHQLFEEYTDYAQRNQELINCLDNLILQIPYVECALYLQEKEAPQQHLSHLQHHKGPSFKQEVYSAFNRSAYPFRKLLATVRHDLTATRNLNFHLPKSHDSQFHRDIATQMNNRLTLLGTIYNKVHSSPTYTKETSAYNKEQERLRRIAEEQARLRRLEQERRRREEELRRLEEQRRREAQRLENERLYAAQQKRRREEKKLKRARKERREEEQRRERERSYAAQRERRREEKKLERARKERQSLAWLSQPSTSQISWSSQTNSTVHSQPTRGSFLSGVQSSWHTETTLQRVAQEESLPTPPRQLKRQELMAFAQRHYQTDQVKGVLQKIEI